MTDKHTPDYQEGHKDGMRAALLPQRKLFMLAVSLRATLTLYQEFGRFLCDSMDESEPKARFKKLVDITDKVLLAAEKELGPESEVH